MKYYQFGAWRLEFRGALPSPARDLMPSVILPQPPATFGEAVLELDRRLFALAMGYHCIWLDRAYGYWRWDGIGPHTDGAAQLFGPGAPHEPPPVY